MMKISLLAVFFFLCFGNLFAQSSNSIMISAGADVIKTDIDEPFKKAQIGLEANYFVVRHFAVGAGAEFWTDRTNSFVMSMRWYPVDNLFVRLRTLTGANVVAVGVGYAFPLSDHWKLDGIGDFYFNNPQFALRAGISYVIH
jgi:hypothetical protein